MGHKHSTHKPECPFPKNILSEACQSVIKFPIDKATDSACAPVGAGFGGLCDMMGGGPEDPVADVACGAGTAGVIYACGVGVDKAIEAATKGTPVDPDAIAKEVCDREFC